MNKYTLETRDGILLTDIPDSVPKTSPILRAIIERMRAEGRFESSFDVEHNEPQTDPMGLMGAVVRGAGPVAAGMAVGAGLGLPFGGVGAIPGAAAGGGAMALAQLAGDPLIGAINSLFGTNYEKPTEAIQRLFTHLGIPEPDTAAERIVQTAASGFSGTAGTVGLGQSIAAGSKPVASSLAKTISDFLATTPTRQLASGVGSGIAAQGAKELGLGPVEQTVASIAGGTIGSGLAGLTIGPKPDVPLAEAKRHGIRVLTADVFPPETPFGKWIMRRTEEMPLGTAVQYRKQLTEQLTAVQNLLDDYGVGGVAKHLTQVAADFLAKRAREVKKRVEAKREVINRLTSEDSPVPTDNLTPLIDDEIKRLEAAGPRLFGNLINKLKDIKTDTTNKSLASLETNRDTIRKLAQTEGLADVADETTKIARGLSKALNEDMGNYITRVGSAADYTKWKVANTELREMMQDLKKTGIKHALNKGEYTPETIKSVVFSDKPSDVKTLYDGLTKRGQRALKQLILSEAAEQAQKHGKELTASNFVKKLSDLSVQKGIAFDKDELEVIDGLMRVVKYTSHAQQAVASPMTGIQALMPLGMTALGSGFTQLFGSGLYGFFGAVATSSGMGLLARVYQSEPIRNMLMTLSKVKVGSHEEAALLRRLLGAIQIQAKHGEEE